MVCPHMYPPTVDRSCGGFCYHPETSQQSPSGSTFIQWCIFVWHTDPGADADYFC